MRVTDRMIYDNATASTQRARERLEEAVLETSSGRRVTHPGDDPAAATLITQHKLAKERMEAIRRTTGRASDEMGQAWDSLSSVTDILTKAKERAIQFSNASYNATDRTAGAFEMDSLLRSAVGALNAQMGDRYIFGGNKDDAPPFDLAGNYMGDAGVRRIEIAPGVLEDVSVRADVAVKGAGGGVDVLGVLSALATALRNNDPNAVRAQIDGLDASIKQVSQANVEVSATVATLDTAQSVSMTSRDKSESEISSLGDADLVAAATKLQLANHALEAALSASAKSFQMSLLGKLG